MKKLDKQKIIPFNYHGHPVRTVTIDDEPWFVAKDVCDVLGISKYRDALDRLDGDERGSVQVDTLGGPQNMASVNEPGLYSLTLGSKKPEAKPFKRWVTHEVIPTIRKTGGYVNNDDAFINTYLPFADDTTKSLFRGTLSTIRHLNAQIEEDKPHVIFSKAVNASSNSILVRELAHMMRQNGVQTGEHRLFKWMRDNGFLHKNSEAYNQPTQYSLERGLMEVKESCVIVPGKGPTTHITTKITGKGQTYFMRRICKSDQLKVGEKA